MLFVLGYIETMETDAKLVLNLVNASNPSEEQQRISAKYPPYCTYVMVLFLLEH